MILVVAENLQNGSHGNDVHQLDRTVSDFSKQSTGLKWSLQLYSRSQQVGIIRPATSPKKEGRSAYHATSMLKLFGTYCSVACNQR